MSIRQCFMSCRGSIITCSQQSSVPPTSLAPRSHSYSSCVFSFVYLDLVPSCSKSRSDSRESLLPK